MESRSTNSTTVWLESWSAMKTIMKVPTFQFIVLQGLIGSVPWTAIVFITLWFELIGTFLFCTIIWHLLVSREIKGSNETKLEIDPRV